MNAKLFEEIEYISEKLLERNIDLNDLNKDPGSALSLGLKKRAKTKGMSSTPFRKEQKPKPE